MSTFMLCVGVTIGIYFFVYNMFVKAKRCHSKVKLHGKTVIITGGNTGIGKATAVDLAKRGARVILACRNKRRAESALRDISAESRSSNVVYMHLDLASLQSVRSFAEEFLKTESRLDLLINNAGLFEAGKTEEGLGMMFGVNHIGHFLLTSLLLERLKKCGPSRVVNVSSYGHNFGSIDFDCLTSRKDLGVGTSAMAIFKMYCHSKLCNVLYTHELAKRLQGTNVTCYSLHPGAVNTELSRHTSTMMKILIKPITLLFFKDAESGAQTTLYCALQEGIEPLSGCYFSGCTMRNVSAKARDDAVARKLWEVSERLCGLS